MYAIIRTGGKQYQAEKNQTLIVEKIEGDEGATIELEEVLAVVDGAKTTVGSPFVKGAKVKAEIIRQTKGPKINGYNYKPKKNERKRWGHRQPETHLKVVEVVAGK